MASTTYYLRRSAATVMGAGLVGLSGWFSYAHSGDVTGPIAAIVGATMLHFAEHAWSEKQRLRAVSLGALSALALLTCLSFVLDRVATAYDAKLQDRQSGNLSRSEARKALDQAEATAKLAEQAAVAECSSGRGLRCREAEGRADAARQRVAETRSRLVQAGAQVAEDPMARRLAAVTGVGEAAIALYQPLMLPVWLELSGLVLLTYGLSPGSQAPKEAVARKRTKRVRRTRHRFKASVGKPVLRAVP
jgi:hypothetical protein